MTASCNRPRNGPRLATAVFATLLPLARVASGHDFWIEPETFRPKANSVVKVTLRVGENFRGEEVPRNPEKIAAFVLAGPSAVTANQMQSAGSNLDTREILGVLAKSPAGLAKITDPGMHVIGYRSNHAYLTLPASKFEAYLKEEGLDHVIATRRERGESDKDGREMYSRYAKSLLLAQRIEETTATAWAGSGGQPPNSGFDRKLGFTLEIIPLKDPFALGADQTLPIQLLYQGKPLENIAVSALARDEPTAAATTRTDGDGRAIFHLKPGVWMIKCVHMVPASKREPADWESFWASLTFEVPSPVQQANDAGQ